MLIKKFKNNKLTKRLFHNRCTVEVVVKGNYTTITDEAHITIEGGKVEGIDDGTYKVEPDTDYTLNISHSDYKPYSQTFTAMGNTKLHINMSELKDEDDNEDNSIHIPLVDPTPEQIERYTGDEKLTKALRQHHEEVTHLLDDRIVFASNDSDTKYATLLFKETEDNPYDTNYFYKYIIYGEKTRGPLFSTSDEPEEKEFLITSERFVSPLRAINKMDSATYGM